MLYFTDAENERIDRQANNIPAESEERKKKEVDQLDRKKRKIQEDLSYLESNKLALLKGGVYSPESFIEEVDKLDEELFTMQTQRVLSDEEQVENLHKAKKLSELLKNLTELYRFVKTEEKEEIVRNIYSELYFSENTLKTKVHSGFECLERRLVLSCSKDDWFSELAHNIDDITETINTLEKLLDDEK